MLNDKVRAIMLDAMSKTFNGPDPDGDIKKMYIPNEFARVFAEEIINKCIQAVNDCTDDKESAYDMGVRVSARAIKNTFEI